MAVQIEIFDTTLRDGEQSPGASMDEREKVQMAQQLDRLGVDIIEAGFPIASNQEFEAVRKVGQAVERARVAALARALTKDIERAAAALELAKRPVLHTFLATSSWSDSGNFLPLCGFNILSYFFYLDVWKRSPHSV